MVGPVISTCIPPSASISSSRAQIISYLYISYCHAFGRHSLKISLNEIKFPPSKPRHHINEIGNTPTLSCRLSSWDLVPTRYIQTAHPGRVRGKHLFPVQTPQKALVCLVSCAHRHVFLYQAACALFLILCPHWLASCLLALGIEVRGLDRSGRTMASWQAMQSLDSKSLGSNSSFCLSPAVRLENSHSASLLQAPCHDTVIEVVSRFPHRLWQ